MNFHLPSSANALTRRDFLRKSSLLGGAALIGGHTLTSLAEEKAARPSSETLVTQLYKSFNEEQQKAVCFAFDNPLRTEVDNNWHITEQRLSKFYTADQQDLIKQIFMGIHSDEYAATVYKQVEQDSGKEGFMGGSAIAIFGEPGTGKFEFVLTGRHCTRRCDGDSVEGTAFGGPIFYGHAAESFNEKPDHPNNAYWYQAQRANAVFGILDGKQREKALCLAGRAEEGLKTVKLTGKKEGLDGIRLGDLSADQKDAVMKTLEDVLAPYRQADVAEAMKYIKGAGIDDLHMAFYKRGDLGKDKVWDNWQIEGPSMISYFRGAPHVHAWLHVRKEAQA